MDKRIPILELSEDARRIVGESELTGGRTLFERNDRPVAILISFDEYTSLCETIDIASDSVLRSELDAAEKELARNALMLPEDLFEA
jgi:PHD/YefM family antitoxin component YafN of YafNO toxin-antitoxin module